MYIYVYMYIYTHSISSLAIDSPDLYISVVNGLIHILKNID